MNCQNLIACAAILLGLTPSLATAQSADTPGTSPAETTLAAAPTLNAASTFATPSAPAADLPVQQYCLDGPRIGMTFMANGEPRTQFGWHTENQAAPGSRGPWFLVERIFLIGGVERNEFIPTGSLIFGVRTPDSFEFGIGPSLSIGAGGASTAVVLAAGKTLRYGGIRVPVNVALALSERNGTTATRFTVISGWAIKQSEADRHRARRPYRYGLER